jgi:hypothetical protein
MTQKCTNVLPPLALSAGFGAQPSSIFVIHGSSALNHEGGRESSTLSGAPTAISCKTEKGKICAQQALEDKETWRCGRQCKKTIDTYLIHKSRECNMS